jgi:hypothetical protein
MAYAISNWRDRMKISGALGVIAGAVALCMAPFEALAAGKYDGSAPLLCVPIVVSECGPDGDCKRVTADSVNLPQLLKVDVKAQKVYSEETGRASPFRSIEHLDGNMVLQGAQAGRGWTMTIAEETGKMSAAISSGGEGWVVFGACMLLP